jgi:hypothetical protein
VKKQNKNLLPDGNVVNLKHFIYLDRDRLTSYSSQFSDGIIQLRRLTENIGNRSVDSPVEQYAEEIIEKNNETELSLGPKAHAGGVSVKNANKNTNRRGFKGGGTATTDESFQSYSQDEVDHDNAYLRLEEKLIKENLLVEVNTIDELIQDSRLIKIKGITRFFDWDSLKGLITNFDSLIPFIAEQQEIDESQTAMLSMSLNAAKVMIENFSIGEITVHTHIENAGIISSLNPAYLCMTRDQLRAAYILSGDVEITIVGYSPKRASNSTSFTGVAAMIDHFAPSLWQGLVGNVDFVLEPIAIYAETNLK